MSILYTGSVKAKSVWSAMRYSRVRFGGDLEDSLMTRVEILTYRKPSIASPDFLMSA